MFKAMHVQTSSTAFKVTYSAASHWHSFDVYLQNILPAIEWSIYNKWYRHGTYLQ